MFLRCFQYASFDETGSRGVFIENAILFCTMINIPESSPANAQVIFNRALTYCIPHSNSSAGSTTASFTRPADFAGDFLVLTENRNIFNRTIDNMYTLVYNIDITIHIKAYDYV